MGIFDSAVSRGKRTFSNAAAVGPRPQFSQAERREMFEEQGGRDHFGDRLAGPSGKDGVDVGHIIPRSLPGGTDFRANLRLEDASQNRSKGNRLRFRDDL